MTALSIRRMHETVVLMEQRAEDREMSLPATRETQHYWWVERKARRGKKWIFVAEFFGSKRDVADFWRKNYQHKSKQFRLRHMLKYQ